ncbi:MAG: UDP-N-acetylglucosamine 2-epimerase (non-hydrolyzing) [Opitutus sp.]|nr:UDP-N-acetylglucosamine 2-epimerase (non-hydrolyzing) [Opitutus sp.]
MKTIALIVGTRPEAIKMAPVYRALAASGTLKPVLVSTGQHREMLQQTLRAFELRPDVDLDLMQHNQTLPDLTARVLTAMTRWLAEALPAAVLTQGDTTTAFAAALAAFYARIPVGHVEAGLRTYDFEAPWPEEMNRRLADPIARWCYAPTELSRENLLAERIPAAQIFVTGNTVVDALLWMRDRQRVVTNDAAARAVSIGVPTEFARKFFAPVPIRWLLVTGHRRESFGQGFENICRALAQLADRYPDLGILYPVHLNPNVQEPVRRLLGDHARIALIPPLGYEDFVWAMDRAHFIISDSGGVQEEAPSLGKPVLVMRSTTERPEGVTAGTSRLVGTDEAAILREAALLLDDPAAYAERSRLRNPYGDGQASARIAAQLETALSPT